MYNDGKYQYELAYFLFLRQPILQKDQTLQSIDLRRITVHRGTCPAPPSQKRNQQTFHVMPSKNHPCPTSLEWRFAPSPNLGSSHRLPQSQPPPLSHRSRRRGRRRCPWRAGPARGRGSASHESDRQSLGVGARVLFDLGSYEVMRNFKWVY